MQYEIVFKGNRCCSCYICLPQSSPAAQTAVKMVAAPGTGTLPKDQRLLTIATNCSMRYNDRVDIKNA